MPERAPERAPALQWMQLPWLRWVAGESERSAEALEQHLCLSCILGAILARFPAEARGFQVEKRELRGKWLLRHMQWSCDTLMWRSVASYSAVSGWLPLTRLAWPMTTSMSMSHAQGRPAHPPGCVCSNLYVWWRNVAAVGVRVQLVTRCRRQYVPVLESHLEALDSAIRRAGEVTTDVTPGNMAEYARQVAEIKAVLASALQMAETHGVGRVALSGEGLSSQAQRRDRMALLQVCVQVCMCMCACACVCA